MTDVVFPTMSKDGASTGVVATWYVADGEAVTEGQLVGDVAMDKVDAEVLAPAAGTVALTVAESEEVKEGSVIATIT